MNTSVFTVVMAYKCFINGNELYINHHDFNIRGDITWLVLAVFETLKQSNREDSIIKFDNVTIKFLFNGKLYYRRNAKEEQKQVVIEFNKKLDELVDNHNKPIYDAIEMQEKMYRAKVEREEYETFLRLYEKFKPEVVIK